MADIWITRDGKQINIKKMTDSHLKNSVVLFGRDKEGNKKRWKMLEKEAKARGWDIENEIYKEIEPDEPIDNRWEILDI